MKGPHESILDDGSMTEARPGALSGQVKSQSAPSAKQMKYIYWATQIKKCIFALAQIVKSPHASSA
jgi:hypothetical protein